MSGGGMGGMAVWDRIRKSVAELGEGPYVKVGLLNSKGGGDTDPKTGATMTEIGTINELGDDAAGIPARPFIRGTVELEAEAIGKFQGDLVKKVVEGHLTAERALDLLGAKVAGDIKKRVAGGPHIPPPNAPATIAAKGSDRPLVDTGQLVNSVNWEVVK